MQRPMGRPANTGRGRCACLVVLGIVAAQPCAAAELAAILTSAGVSPGQMTSGATGIARVTMGPGDLSVPPGTPEGQVLRYGLGFPFQVAPKQAAVFCNLRVEGLPVVDFENGTDVILFDDLANIGADEAIPVSRNEEETDPASGNPRIVVKYPMIGGFVPLGARRADGSPHPHAGTGFGICQAISFPVAKPGQFSWETERKHGLEVHQLAYDGEEFRAARSDPTPGAPHPRVADTQWTIHAPGITNAVPDGDDLLQPVLANDGKVSVSGVVRWQRRDGAWLPASFAPVTPRGESWCEPSLVRDGDRALLLCARGYGAERVNLTRVWRSGDAEARWELAIEAPRTRHEAPVSINRAADGTPYIGANLLGHGRETLCVWPLNAERTGLGNAMIIRNARGDFGAPPGGSHWMVDHPSGATVRLADGKWHHVLVYRILEQAEHRGADPPPQTACYIEEVVSAGPPIPSWRFE